MGLTVAALPLLLGEPIAIRRAPQRYAFEPYAPVQISRSDAFRRSRSPEELELDVVGVAEREHGIRRVVEVLDARVWDTELIESFGPLIEVYAGGDEELQVVETGPKLGERLAGVLCVADQAEHQRAARLDEADVAHLAIG